MADWIATVTPTIQDGTVVRWYRDMASAQSRAELVSASRNGVLIHGYLHEVPSGVLLLAKGAHEVLRAHPAADLSHLATHRRRIGGRLDPITTDTRHGGRAPVTPAAAGRGPAAAAWPPAQEPDRTPAPGPVSPTTYHTDDPTTWPRLVEPAPAQDPALREDHPS